MTDDVPSVTVCHNLRLRLILCYFLFGALHELCHVFAAVAVLVAWAPRLAHKPASPASALAFFQDIVNHCGGGASFITRTFLLRRTDIPFPQQTFAYGNGVGDSDGDGDALWIMEGIVRHSGWVFSVVLAMTIVILQGHVMKQHRKRVSTASVPILAIASSLTALEAVSTDLLRLRTLPIFGPSSPTPSMTSTFFCGNFGLIVLNSAWTWIDGGKHTLDLLEKMVSITMMRGAQSGGIVTFAPSKRKNPATDPIVAFRSRVVNRKRSDLSVLLRRRVEKDLFSLTSHALSKGREGKTNGTEVQTYSGHTRFATSSKASFDGTHPHRWSSPVYRRMYNFGIFPDRGVSMRRGFPRNIRVENYITHNGDFDLYTLNDKIYDLEVIRPWLEMATGHPCPAVVDSACIAGFVDLIRSQGCFALSARYAVCLGLSSSKISKDPTVANLPTNDEYDMVATIFEEELDAMLKTVEWNLESIGSSDDKRKELTTNCVSRLSVIYGEVGERFFPVAGDLEDGGGQRRFAETTVDAFFDNDLFNTMKIFLANASGSFGLCIQSSLDVNRQLCLAARGQTASIAFYPSKGIVCYGSEQAAVKVAMSANLPYIRRKKTDNLDDDIFKDIDQHDVRLDLDDLTGELCLIDWGGQLYRNEPISRPNRNIASYPVMNGKLKIYLLREGANIKAADPQLYHRMTRLSDNQFILPLPPMSKDLILTDIHDIPRVCREIQEDWRNMSKTNISFNRLTGWNLARCIRKKMESYVSGTASRSRKAVDILITGCEVSLWVGEQFASDLQKAFPGLNIVSVSSNKLLGVYGQEMNIPAVGYPMSQQTSKLDDAIVIIVSHSGGTFSPLAVSNLLNNSQTFVVTSEWDVQIGKQLRNAHNESDMMMLLFNSKVFTTNVGMRPAEPCSISVAATQQLLTCIFQHICLVILSDNNYRNVSGAIISEHDLQVLERCNQDNIAALEQIVGVDSLGNKLPDDMNQTERELRESGHIWANHVLENARAYVLSFIYVVATVVSGYPVASGIAVGTGVKSESIMYLFRFVDALIYFFLPQINVLLIRVFQGRPLRHRMVGRTVVIGDCPWVSQAAEAFLSKIFAVSYSIAGLNVLSGNPADHFVHRHTHRVVRGSLIVCGRPDGRLAALTSLEASCCLSVNQASSIQSLGSTAESITIGHNPFKLPLTARAIFFDRNRPQFLCEQMLNQAHDESMKNHNTLELDMVGTSKRMANLALRQAVDAQKDEGQAVMYDSAPIPTLILKDIEGLFNKSKEEDNFVPSLDDTSYRSKLVSFRRNRSRRKVHHIHLPKIKNRRRHSYDPENEMFVNNWSTHSLSFPKVKRRKSHSNDEENEMFAKNWSSHSFIMRGASKKRLSQEDALNLSIHTSMDSLFANNTSVHALAMNDLFDKNLSMHSLSSSGLASPTTGRSRSDSVGGNRRSMRKKQSSSNSLSSMDREEGRSSTALLGAYMDLQSAPSMKASGNISTEYLLDAAIHQHKWHEITRKIFLHLDTDGDGILSQEEFVSGYPHLKPEFSTDELVDLFERHDENDDGAMSLQEFESMMKSPELMTLPEMEHIGRAFQSSIRDENGIIQVRASKETYFGEYCTTGLDTTEIRNPAVISAAKAQDFAQELYESRVASMQRFVGMAVLFHEMASGVEGFFRRYSLGLLGYRYDRTHSIMRIATTASPVSGADVGERMRVLKMLLHIHEAVQIISVAWHRYRKRKGERYLAKLELIARKTLQDGTTPESSALDSLSSDESVLGGGDLGRICENSEVHT